MTNLPVSGQFKITCIYHQKGNKWACGHHTGVDIVSFNKLVYSTCDGIVYKVGFDKSYGNYVVIYNKSDDTYHWFCHLLIYKVKIGTIVNRSKIIGVMGSTGNSTGVHLHYEIRLSCNKYDMTSNPCSYMGIPNKIGFYDSNNYHIDKNKHKIGDIVFISCKDTGARNSQAHASLIEIDSDLPFVGSVPKQIWVYDSSLNNNNSLVRCVIAHDSGDRYIVELDTIEESSDNKQIWITKGVLG